VRKAVNTAIAQLPPRQRSAIILYELENRPVREIAEILECSEGAVKFNLHEARKKLQELLRDQLTETHKEGVPRKQG
jgi:RNA polymerase sigma-70 factor (ECF subfamily)